jgi:hypothetical protein
MLTIGSEKLFTEKEILTNARAYLRDISLSKSPAERDKAVRDMTVLLSKALKEDLDYVRGALSGRFEVTV